MDFFFKDESDFWVESKLSGVKVRSPVGRVTGGEVAVTKVITVEVAE